MLRFPFWLFRALFYHADLSSAPQRAVEYLLAWCIIGWSSSTFIFGGVMNGPVYAAMLAIAPEGVWGSFGICFGGMRIVALIVNGSWRRTPLFRFAGAAVGMMWWYTIFGLFLLDVRHGAQPFPMLCAYPVFVLFELLSCFRCGFDAKAMRSFSFAPRIEPVARGEQADG